jgi:hypothetical protein
MIRYLAFVRYWRKKLEYNGTGHQLFVDFKRAYESVWMEVLYNIHLEFVAPLKPTRPIKMSPNETYSIDSVGKYLSDKFPIQNDLK